MFCGTHLRLNPDKMNIQALDIGLEVRELVEEGLSFAEVVLVSPVVQPAVHLSGVEAIFKGDAFERRCELTVVLYALSEVFYHLKQSIILCIQLSCFAIN